MDTTLCPFLSLSDSKNCEKIFCRERDLAGLGLKPACVRRCADLS